MTYSFFKLCFVSIVTASAYGLVTVRKTIRGPTDYEADDCNKCNHRDAHSLMSFTLPLGPVQHAGPSATRSELRCPSGLHDRHIASLCHDNPGDQVVSFTGPEKLSRLESTLRAGPSFHESIQSTCQVNYVSWVPTLPTVHDLVVYLPVGYGENTSAEYLIFMEATGNTHE
ncbi:hypothetical protein DFH05DRAFT_1504580 [Lentinula detonsa]|uniref:Uncharacterized protein n=1 Tax=Lentinula detonsa TaxID=2804962 RepID=A0A9W8NUH1_9AGAR|nr:hypothetical protein DFH05DRAFT_1504580 [Lentinula detonsa]